MPTWWSVVSSASTGRFDPMQRIHVAIAASLFVALLLIGSAQAASSDGVAPELTIKLIST